MGATYGYYSVSSGLLWTPKRILISLDGAANLNNAYLVPSGLTLHIIQIEFAQVGLQPSTTVVNPLGKVILTMDSNTLLFLTTNMNSIQSVYSSDNQPICANNISIGITNATFGGNPNTGWAVSILGDLR
jgi:DNA-binding beta-propeller fold protein YncE